MGNIVQGITQSGAGGLAAGLTANQQEGATNAGNVYSNGSNVNLQDLGNASAQAYNMASGVNNGAAGYQNYQNQVQQGPITSQLYGEGGSLSKAIGQLNNLNANPGLTAQDQTAYGQASGQIANQFGAQQNSIAQGMANRGMSNSGAAGAAFSGSMGNQAEQLGQLQTQIAQNREQMNLNQANSLQGFISNLGGQANNAIGQAQGAEGQQYGQLMNYLGAAQGQNNAQLDQMQKTAHASTLGNAMTGLSGGLNAANSSGSSSSGGSKDVPMGTSSGFTNGTDGSSSYAGMDASAASDSSSMFA